MRRCACVGVVLVWMACVGGAAARDVDLPSLSAWQLPSYTLIAEDGYETRALVQRLADTERALSKLLARPVKPDPLPTLIWLVPKSLWGRYLAPGSAIAGEFVPRRFSNYLIINADLAPFLVRNGLQHEYTHYFLRTQLGGIYPLWFDEGMAELMTKSRFGSSHVTFDAPRMPQLFGWIPMARLFDIDKSSREYLEAPMSSAVHLESWAIVHRGLIADSRFGNQMFAYLSEVNRLIPSEDAVPRTFKSSFEQLDESMRAYFVQPQVAIGSLPLERGPRIRMPALRQMEPAEACEILAKVMLDTGFNPQNAAEVVDKAQQLDPDAPAVAMLRLRLAVRDRRDTDALRLARALTANDVATLRDTALALFERVREPDASLSAESRGEFERAAFALLGRALVLDAGDAPASWGYALLAVRLGTGVDGALDHLTQARGRMPGHPDLAEATALALEARGSESAMLPFLTDMLRNTNSPDQRIRAVRRIRELRISEKEKAPQ